MRLMSFTLVMPGGQASSLSTGLLGDMEFCGVRGCLEFLIGVLAPHR